MIKSNKSHNRKIFHFTKTNIVSAATRLHHEDHQRKKKEFPDLQVAIMNDFSFLFVFMSAMKFPKSEDCKNFQLEIYDFSHNNIFMAINANDMAEL